VGKEEMKTPPTVSDLMAALMSNEELREAIKYAHDTANSMGAANPLCPPWYRHLDALLEIQRGRAAACCLDNSNAAGEVRRNAVTSGGLLEG